MFELDDSFYETEPEAVQVPYAEERGTTMDIIHDIYTGVGETADLIGRGIGSETVQGIGKGMLKSSFARPDISQYYNTDSRVGRVVDGIVRSLPTTAVLGGATALASVLTTPAGGAATFAAGLGVIGHGSYDQALEQIQTERPDLSEAEQKRYATINGLSEAGTEALGWLVPFGIGKSAGRALSGVATKKLATALMDSGRVTSDQVVASTIKRIGAKESIAGLFGGAVADGTSEVANELIQSANRDSVGLDSSLPDLVDVFLIGSAPGGVIAGGTMAMSQRHKTIVRNKLNEGLASDDIDTRMNTLDTISMGLSKIDPEIGDSYKNNMLDKVQAGPVSLETLVETPEESIINNPDPTLQAEGIPTNSNPIDTATTAKPVVEGTSLEGTSPEGTPLKGTLPEGTSLEAAQGAVVPDAPNGIGAQESVVTTPPQVAPTRYQKAVEAMSQEPARKAAVERGIQEIETQTQELATNTGLSLKQRKKLSKNIEENRKLVEEEVADVLNEPKVEEPIKVTKEPIVATKVEPAKKPIVITKAGEPVKKPIVITKVGEPIEAAKEPGVTTKVEPIKVAKPKAVKSAKVKPIKIEPEEADSTPLSPEGIQEAMSMSSNGFTPEESFAMAKEGIKADTAISLKKQKVPNKYIAALAKKNITKVTVPVEALRTNQKGSNKLARAEWTDGTIVESAKTKALRWKVIGKDGLERRAPNLTVVRKAIESGKVSELEPFENKTTREKKTDSITRPLTEEEQQTITEYLLDSVNNPKATNPLKKPAERVEVTPEEMAKLVVKMGAGKLKPNVARDIMNSGSVLYKALTYEMSENGGLTDEGVRAMIVRLLNEEQNASDAAKKSKEGISREVTSYDTILDKEEVKAHGVKPEKQVELSDEGEELEGELTGELTEEGTDTDTEVMDDVEEESGIGAAPREEREFSGIEAAALKEKGPGTETESKPDPTQYTQEDKGKYQTFQEWREPTGEKVTRAKHSKDAKVFYVTQDKRYVLEPKKDENNRISFELWKNGKDTGESFNNPEEAMEWAKDSDIEEDTPSQGEAIAEASKNAYGLEEAIKKLKALSPSEDIQEAISILEKEAAPKEEPGAVEEPEVAEKPVRKKGIGRKKKKTEEAKTEEPATEEVATEEQGLKEEKNPEALKPLQQKEANEKIKAGKLDISTEANKLVEKHMSDPRGLAGGIAELYKLEDSPEVERAIEILQVLRETEPAPVGTFATRWKNGLVTLEWLANNSGAIDNVTQELAKFLLKNVDHHKLESVVVEFDNKDHYQNGIVYFGYTTRYSTMLHEIVHGITSEVMNSDGEFSNEVTALRKFVLAHAKKTGAITEEEARGLAISKTSADYIENVGIKEINLAYGLVNNKEFLAMAFSDEHFQTLLKSIKMENSTLFHRVVAAIAKALGLGKDYTALEEAINLVPAITKGKEAYSASQDIVDFDLAPPKVDERVPRTDEEVSAIMAGKGPKEKIREKLFEKGKDIMAFANDALRPISDRIEARSEKIYGSLMAMETRLKLKQREYSRKVKPFMTWYKGLTESQRTRYDLALMNSNTSENQGILKEIPTAIMSNVREVLEDLRQRSEDVGLGTENKEFYFPRRVHDVAGLIEHTNKDHEYKGPMALAFKEEMKKLGVKELTEEQKTQVITDVLQRGYMRQLPRPGANKKRTVPFVDRGSYEFYSNSSDSLMGHIYEMNEKVGQREFVGGSTRKKKIQTLLADMRHINKMKDGPKRQAAIAEYDIRARELEDLEKDLSDGVSALIYQQLGREPANVQNEVIDLINARMRQRGANGIVDFMRNVGYATTMGNFMSAITQLGDIPILLYYYGVNKDSLGAVGTAFKNVYKIAKGDIHGKLGETDAFVDQVDFLDTLREFSSNSMSAATVDKLFKYSGLKYADLIGKEAFMQAGYKHYQKKQNREEFLKKYKPMFGNKVQEVWQKFQLGKKTDEDVLTVLVSELAKFQPATLSQQSKMYLVGGNARVFWMLKTFTLRSTSAALREGVNEINKGNTAKGVAKVATILALYSAAGAGADELKDIIRGKESGFLDNTMDNMLQMLFMSKYSLETGFKKGAPLKTLVAENLIPPLRFADDFLTDVASLTGITDKEFKAKSLNSVPFIGNTAYSRSSAGQAGYASQERTAILEEVKSNKKKQRSAYAGGLSERINKYNQTATEKITSSTIQRVYKGDTK